MEYIVDNLKEILENIDMAAKKLNRNVKDITLIGVTKTIDPQRIQKMVECGISNLGENKVQEIQDKFDKINGDVNWHMIGHLQTNKVKYIIDKVKMIHSVDSLKLAQEISKRAISANKTIDILIEINIAKEDSKHGIYPEDAKNLALEIEKLEGIRVCGLMCVAPFVEISEQNRVHFSNMRQLFIDIKKEMNNNRYMEHLSMGMTNDYVVAIEEGATLVRIGTAIFGKRI